MKIAIPVENGKLCSHFGHCKSFAIIEADESSKKIIERTELPAPPHEPGSLPAWLAEQGVNLVIAGGLGSRAQNLLTRSGINVVIGAPSDTPEALVTAFLEEDLLSGPNICDH